jgi:hypothetical protein
MPPAQKVEQTPARKEGRRERSMRQNRLLARWMILVASLCLAAACGRGKEEKVIIMGPSDVTLYSEAGGVGMQNAQVSSGEFAAVLERRMVGTDPPDARPGEWLKIRTVFKPREGWISAEFTRPAPAD